jgi:hypothetical protein
VLLTIRFPGAETSLAAALLGEEERQEEFWFGQGLAWVGTEGAAIHCLLQVDMPRIVGRTKRRDKDDRFSVGYCDPYRYTATGLMALFLSELKLRPSGDERCAVAFEISSYPERPYGIEIARRLFSPLGYSVTLAGGCLRVEGEGRLSDSLRKLPALLLALDRRTRTFLSTEERTNIKLGDSRWISAHPASRAIEQALSGRQTPLRFLVPSVASSMNKAESEEEYETDLLSGDGSISMGFGPKIPLSESQKLYALRGFSRMNIDRRWLIYLPSAIASLQGSDHRGELETPADAIGYFRDERIEKVVVEEKHMGSRGIVVICRSHKAARDRFGVDGDVPGCVYTRNGRRFFKDEDTELVFLERLSKVLSRARFWDRFGTDWALFDGEILPWAVKAAESSEESSLVEAGLPVLRQAATVLRDADTSLTRHLLADVERERATLELYDGMFKKYRTEAADLAALKFAPFHLLAVEGQAFFNRSHLWHMQMLARVARAGGGFVIPTRYEVIATSDRTTWQSTLRWWEELSAKSEEGLVVKPLPFVPKGRRGMAQPALKCRSTHHLRLVYGPEYDSRTEHEALIARMALSQRRNKHRRILRQFALSMEAVERFVKRSPMEDVHRCVLGVLAQEVAPISPSVKT